MSFNLIESIRKEKDLSFVKNIQNLDINEKVNNYNYKDIIGFYNIEESMKKWKEIEGRFVSEVEKIFLKDKNQFSIEPYLIFFIDKDKYFECLEDIVKIERDEFYCRKFVYPVGEGENVIEKLPFGNPLSFKIKRQNFISAEKTLINLGLDINKAQVLTKKTMSDQLKEQMIEYFGEFELEIKDPDSNFKDSTVKNCVRLKEMQIQGFRTYGKNEIFDLDADLVVLYGPNGLGKTSFFDAFEYGVTEEIKRFSNKDDKLNITKLIKNFAVDNNDSCRIKIKFEVSTEDETNDVTFERIMGQTRVDLILPSGKTRKEETRGILKAMTQKSIFLKKDEIVKLFRATHINNQGDSELTENVIKGNSVISNEILGKMISFEDYTDVDDNLNKIINKNNEVIKTELRNRLENLFQKGEELNQKYESRQSILQNPKYSETLVNLEDELKTRLKVDLNIILSKLEKKYIENELLSKIEAESKNVQFELNNANDAAQIKLEFIKLKGENDKLELNKTRVLIKEIKDKLVILEQQEAATRINNEYNDSKLKEKERMQIECDRFLSIQLNRNITSENIQALQNEKRKTTFEIDDLHKKIEDINKKENIRRNSLLQIDSRLYSVREEIKDIEVIYTDYDKYTREKKRKDIISVDADKYTEEIEENLKQKEDLSKEISNLNAMVNTLESEIEQEKIDNGELENLLLSMKKHVNKRCCPVCDSIHESPEDILDVIDKKLNNISEQQKTKHQKLDDFKEHKEVKQKQYVDISSKIQNLKNRFNEILKEKEQINISCEKFVVKLNKIGIACDKNEIRTTLDTKRGQENVVLEIFKESSAIGKEYEVRFLNFQKEMNRKTAELEEINKSVLAQSNLLDSWDKEMLKLENLQVFNRINFGDTLQRLDFTNEIDNEIKSIGIKISKLNENLEIYKSKKNAHLKDMIMLQKELEDGVKINNEYKKIESNILLIRDTKKVDIDNLDLYYQKYTKRLGTLALLKSKALAFLKLVEFESLSIEQKELELEIEINRKEIESIKNKMDKYEVINKKIKEVQKKVKVIQHDIVKNYCKNVEPLVSIIQNRLRALYGFSDLSLSLDEGSDEVNIKTSHYILEQKNESNKAILGHESVDRNELNPCQYFSEGQKNIINLSLFLSNTLSQNWSGFKTIFLDDPVQHFDDLNTYAFLELLKSLILDNDKNEKKQIIISTCDSRFFSLIKDKFSLLKKSGRVKYYSFESLTRNGPVVKPL